VDYSNASVVASHGGWHVTCRVGGNVELYRLSRTFSVHTNPPALCM